MASNKELADGLVVTVGDYTKTTAAEDMIDKGKSWQYKRAKQHPKEGIKKLKINWDKKRDINKGAPKASLMIGAGAIFAAAYRLVKQ